MSSKDGATIDDAVMSPTEPVGRDPSEGLNAGKVAPRNGARIMLGATMARRNLLLAGCAVLALFGCTTGGQVPQSSAWPGYYAPQRVPYEPWSGYRPAPEPAPRRRYVPPAPAEPEMPDQAALAPAPPPVSRPVPAPAPSFEPADPCVGWWRICHAWD
jgi:hypothetical protein